MSCYVQMFLLQPPHASRIEITIHNVAARVTYSTYSTLDHGEMPKKRKNSLQWWQWFIMLWCYRTVFLCYMIHTSWFMFFLFVFNTWFITGWTVCHGRPDLYAHEGRDEERCDRAEQRVDDCCEVNYYSAQNKPSYRQYCSRLNVDTLILQCLGALLFAFHCWQSFCLLFNMTTVPCEGLLHYRQNHIHDYLFYFLTVDFLEL